MHKVISLKRALIVLAFFFIFSTLTPHVARADSYEYKAYGCTDYIRHDQYEQIVNVLSLAINDDTSQCSTPLHATGVFFGSYQEAIAAKESFQYLFQGEEVYGILVARDGASGTIFGVNRDSNKHCTFSYNYTPGYGSYTLLVGWLPGSDPSVCLAHHNAAIQVIETIVSSAPEDSASAYKYFNDWLCQNVGYDNNFNSSSYSGYGALCTGLSVCSGYSRAFMALCYKAGKYCITLSGTKNGDRHSWNAVWDGLTYKWVDVTWADQGDWINYGDFMSNMDDDWIAYFNAPYCTCK